MKKGTWNYEGLGSALCNKRGLQMYEIYETLGAGKTEGV